MKRIAKYVCIIVCAALMLALLPACRLEHYNKDEIAEWAQENIGKSIYISSEYTERTNDEGYTDRVWTAYLKDMPDLKFEIISHKYWGLESVSHSIESTYGYVYGKYYFEEYCANHETEFLPEYTEPVSYGYMLKAVFNDREHLPQLIDEAESISEYMIDAGIEENIRFAFDYNDPLAKVDDTDVSVFCGCAPNLDATEENILSEFAQYAADYRLTVDQFTEEELAAAAEEFGGQFNITRADGTVVSYSDLSLSRFGYGMSFGCMYEVFTREGFEVEGTVERFTFNGIDGSIYEFSYDFNDYLYEDDKVGYYYIKDGVKTPMDYYFYNHFRTHFIKEISGLSFEDI